MLLAGVTDYREGRMLPGHRSDPHEAMRAAPETDVKILLAHQPKNIFEAARAGYDLQISGHTHGGQVNIPFWGAPILPVHNKSYISGLVTAPKTSIFISKGLGWTILPVRFNCLPEIAVLKLEAI